MPLRLDFTSGPSQQQDQPVPPTRSERTDDPPQTSVALLDDDDDDPEDPRTAVGLMLDDAFDLMDNMFPNRRQDIRVCVARTGGESIAYAEMSGSQVMRKRGMNATVALYRLITGLRNNEQARQASSEQSTNGISGKYFRMR
ncbi:hypothetical protein DIS24_g2304 [Lasiodiplodia hormozganensis]|uniref:Uncharacterized protein n=1 Tax=Lasiodiplodia hormozganensis TaxID=869390 RepID=A0AA39Z1M9_9PEZI|nr:hypothetical protein DIS24_g2304 [Lasiodiplodia hormozganensis]